MKKVFFCMNRHLNTAELLTGKIFSHWEMVQAAFAVGICMSDGNLANGIGRCRSIAEFHRKAEHDRTTVLTPNEKSI